MCVLVFQIGEFVYLIEGAGDLPLTSELPTLDSPNVLRATSEGTVNRREKSKIQQIIFLISFYFYGFFLKLLNTCGKKKEVVYNEE